MEEYIINIINLIMSDTNLITEMTFDKASKFDLNYDFTVMPQDIIIHDYFDSSISIVVSLETFYVSCLFDKKLYDANKIFDTSFKFNDFDSFIIAFEQAFIVFNTVHEIYIYSSDFTKSYNKAFKYGVLSLMTQMDFNKNHKLLISNLNNLINKFYTFSTSKNHFITHNDVFAYIDEFVPTNYIKNLGIISSHDMAGIYVQNETIRILEIAKINESNYVVLFFNHITDLYKMYICTNYDQFSDCVQSISSDIFNAINTLQHDNHAFYDAVATSLQTIYFKICNLNLPKKSNVINYAINPIINFEDEELPFL